MFDNFISEIQIDEFDNFFSEEEIEKLLIEIYNQLCVDPDDKW